MSSLHISQGSFRLSDTRTLTLMTLDIQAGDSWAFVGANGSGKSALARALADELVLLNGERQQRFHAMRCASLSNSCKNWSATNGNATIPTCSVPAKKTPGVPWRKSFRKSVKDPARCAQLAEQFGITPLLSRRFKYLSTGETRKTLLCQRTDAATRFADPG